MEGYEYVPRQGHGLKPATKLDVQTPARTSAVGIARRPRSSPTSVSPAKPEHDSWKSMGAPVVLGFSRPRFFLHGVSRYFRLPPKLPPLLPPKKERDRYQKR
jgi:hypothetical protein